MRICGHHVHSLGFRWGCGLAIFVGMLVITVGAFAPGIIPLYLIMEYVWLKKEDTIVPFSDVTSYAADSNQNLIAIDFHGDRWCRPVVLRTTGWQDLLAILRQKAPERDASGTTLLPPSKTHVGILSGLIFAGSYLLSLCLCAVALVLTIAPRGIPNIGNAALRWPAWVVLFGLPLVPSILLARYYYRRKRSRGTGLVPGRS